MTTEPVAGIPGVEAAAGVAGLAENTATDLLLLVGNEELARVCVEMLGQLGYDTEVIRQAEDIEPCCRRRAPAALILDLQGRQRLVSALRQRQARGELPAFAIVGMTTMTAEPDDRDDAQDRIDGCLVRPLELRQVAVTLGKLAQTPPKMSAGMTPQQVTRADPSDPSEP